MKIHHLFWGICLCFSTNILFAQNYQKTSSGIKTTVNAVDIEVQFFAPAVARVIKSPEGVAYEKQSLSVKMCIRDRYIDACIMIVHI